MLINYNGVPCPKADTLLRFAEPEVVLGQGTPFYCRFELDNPLTYIFSNIRRMGPSGRNLGFKYKIIHCIVIVVFLYYIKYKKGWWYYGNCAYSD